MQNSKYGTAGLQYNFQTLALLLMCISMVSHPDLILSSLLLYQLIQCLHISIRNEVMVCFMKLGTAKISIFGWLFNKSHTTSEAKTWFELISHGVLHADQVLWKSENLLLILFGMIWNEP